MYTPAEKSRLMLYKIAQGNPQAIILALDEIKLLAKEALQGTLDTTKKQFLEKLSNDISEISKSYKKDLDNILAINKREVDRVLKIVETFIEDSKKKVDNIQPRKPTEDELLLLIEPLIPVVFDGKPGHTPTVDELRALMKPLISETIINLQSTEIDKSELEKEADDKLMGMIANEVAKKIVEVKRFSGGGSGDRVKAGDGVTITTNASGQKVITAQGGGFSIKEATGTIDDSNVEFTFTSKPNLIVVNGQNLRENRGWIWDDGTLTATLDNPVGTDGDIYGL